MRVKTKNHSDFLLLLSGHKLTFHDGEGEGFLSLHNAQDNLLDQYKFKSTGKPILSALSNDRYFLQAGNFSYNFRIENAKIVIEKKVEIPIGPNGTVDRIYFFDREKSISVFLNEFEQYNVYIDSANVRLARKETYNTGHLKGISEFTKRPETTPKLIYSRWSKELFLHMPTDASFLSVNLKSNKISMGFIYMEYEQPYTFRRYFDESLDELYVVEENGDQQPELLSVSSFGVADFAKQYRLVDKVQIGFTPVRIMNGQLLYQKIENQGEFFNHVYYFVSLKEASSKDFIKKK
ncbi:MAG: hypothetical protein WBB27_04040 [Maribacter sp.]